jgi:hypothetical protein
VPRKTGVRIATESTALLKRDFLKACTALAAAPLSACFVSRLPAERGPRAETLSEAELPQLWQTLLQRLSPELSALAYSPECEVQIAYTPLLRKRDPRQRPVTYTWQLAPQRWFPAMGLARLPLGLVTAENLFRSGHDLGAAVELEAAPEGGEWSAREPRAEAVERSLRRLWAGDENSAYNRLYEYLGSDALNLRLEALGYRDARLIGHLGGRESADPFSTRGGRLLGSAGQNTLEQWPARQGRERSFPYSPAVGSAWRDEDGNLVEGARDIRHSSFLPLRDVHDMLMALVDPNLVAAGRRWLLKPEQREALLKLLSTLPGESRDPVYYANIKPNDAGHYFAFGERLTLAGLKLPGISGRSLGYVAESRLLRHSDTGAECFLSAVVFCNDGGMLDDDRQRYDSLGVPFLRELGLAALAVTAEM